MAKDRARADEHLGQPPARPLRDYAFLGDGRRGALVDGDGTFAWMCFPGWSDPAVMTGLLASGGAYTVRAEGRRVPGGRYEDGTLIWRGRSVTEHGVIESRDALALPGDERRAVVLRRVRAIDSRARVRVELHLAADYGRQVLRGWRRDAGVWRCEGGPVSARWSGAGEAHESDGLFQMEFDLAAGEHRDLVLELVAGGLDEVAPVDAAEAWARTEQAWRSSVPRCDDLVAHDDVRRAFAVIRGMTPPNGATVAAATTSLPERDEGGRNYDYRYSWIRDSCYVGHAAASVRGAEDIIDGAVAWVASRLLADGDATMPAYRTDGSAIPDEQDLDLPGYPGGHTVTGNRAKNQFQLDLFGESAVLLARAAELDRLDADGWKAAEVAVDVIERNWERDDAGVWEIDPARWTHSRLICVAGLKALAGAGGPRELTARSLTLGDGILSETDRSSLHRSGRWKRAPDDDRVDASLLLAEIRGALPSDDPRSVATRRAVEVDLADQGYVYRYAHPGRELGDDEGAFLICNFWMALAESRAHNTAAAVRWFERGRSAAGSPGLFSEEFDVQQHQLRGNLPQVFVHALLIEAASEQPFDASSFAMSALESIETRVYEVATDQPEADGTLEWSKTTVVVVLARASGAVGTGWTYASGAAKAVIDDQLGDAVVGRDAFDVPRLHEEMVRACRNLGRPGVVSSAISAVDTALWDLKGRLLEIPLVDLFGRCRDDVPVYGSGGFTTYDDDTMAAQLSQWVSELDIPRVKIKIGESWGSREARDLHRVELARQVVGTGVELYVDANGGYTAKQAVRLGRRYQDLGVIWFEEPVSSDDLAGLGVVRKALDLDVAAGEYGYDETYFDKMVRAEAVDCVQVDVTRCGGFTSWLRVAALAGAHGLEVSGHCAPNLHAPVAASVPNLRHVEYFHDHTRLDPMLFDGIGEPKHGALAPGGSPGHGMTLLPAAEQFRVR